MGCKAIEEQTTANYTVKKNQHIYIKDPLLDTLLIQGNIKLTYDYQTMPVELFPEQEGNGVTNIDVCNPCIHHQEINGIQVPVLDIMEVAKRYVINLIDEITNKKLSNIKHPDYKHKDALRLNTIIQILYVSNKDASPKGVIKFIKNYITSLKKHIPPKKRSIFIQTILRNYSKVYKKISYMAKLYNKLTIKQLEGTKEVDFSKFHEDLKKELTKIYDIVDVYQKKLLHNIYIKKTNLFKEIQEVEGEKIQNYLQKINLTNKINSFAYFYEFYSIMDMLKIFL